MNLALLERESESKTTKFFSTQICPNMALTLITRSRHSLLIRIPNPKNGKQNEFTSRL